MRKAVLSSLFDSFRIMWPIKCLQYLDGAFTKNPYPGASERSQLVIECNNLLGKSASS